MKEPEQLNEWVTLYEGDCLEVMKSLPENSIGSIVTDPPYGLGKEPDALAMLRDWFTDGHHDVKGKGFMGKEWDAFVPQPTTWKECLRVLKPGGHLLSFGGTRTYDLVVMGLRIAGFELRDCVMWSYGSGFPKSLDVSKAIDKAGGTATPPGFASWLRAERKRQGITAKGLCERGGFYKEVNHGGLVSNWEAGIGFPNALQFNLLCDLLGLPFDRREEVEREVLGWRKVATGVAFSSDGPSQVEVTAPATDAAREWSGWGTALKPAYEPCVVCRKPVEWTVAENVLKWGTGGLNIDGCRVPTEDKLGGGMVSKGRPKVSEGWDRPWMHDESVTGQKKVESAAKVALAEDLGRWPANLIHDGSEEVVSIFPESKSCNSPSNAKPESKYRPGQGNYQPQGVIYPGDTGSAARFFYAAKASKSERGKTNSHPTVKPLALMQYLIRLVTHKSQTILDPYGGSGTTAIAAMREGVKCIIIERDPSYCQIIRDRVLAETRNPENRLPERKKTVCEDRKADTPTLFDGITG